MYHVIMCTCCHVTKLGYRVTTLLFIREVLKVCFGPCYIFTIPYLCDCIVFVVCCLLIVGS